MIKTKYTEPSIEIIVFQDEDVITTSTGSFDGEWVPIGGRNNAENDNFFN